MPMRVLSINVGSSSIKAAIHEMPSARQMLKLALPLEGEPPEAVFAQIAARVDAAGGAHVAGHRVVHGGERFTTAVAMDDAVLRELEAISVLAPLHNPPALAVAHACRTRWPAMPQFAAFDTGFHAAMPAQASVAQAVARQLPAIASTLRLVSCHLGNGASACAIVAGRSRDTSMGFTPLEGLVMGTRAGDLDPGAILHAQRRLGLSPDAIEAILNHECGLEALSGRGHDVRAIEAAADTGDERARFALEAYAYRVRKYIGAYAAAMGGLDAVAFTGGVGEGSPRMRERICDGLSFLGVRLDPKRNAAVDASHDAAQIHATDTHTAVFVVAAAEELAIAREVHAAVSMPTRTTGPAR